MNDALIDFICPRLELIFYDGNKSVDNYYPHEFYRAFSDFEHALSHDSFLLKRVSLYLVRDPGEPHEWCQKIISFENLM